MAYLVKEIFLSLQGEGANCGRVAVFCRFSGCNLWSGNPDEKHLAICKFCDTDFVGIEGSGGGEYSTPEVLAAKVKSFWPENGPTSDPGRYRPLVIVTGGEPLLQLDTKLLKQMHAAGFEVAVETNGTLSPPKGIDWITVSPKAGSELVIESGNELKLVFPQKGAEPAKFVHLDFEYFFLQPMDGPDLEINTRLASSYCLKNPQWRMGIQMHKFLGIK